jgi:hypothetical protein
MVQNPRLTESRRAEQTARAERLARALRDNLRRRKEQARERAEDPGGNAGPQDGDPPA